MKSSRVDDDLRDLTLGALAANTAVLISIVRLGVVDRAKLLLEIRAVLAGLEAEERQDSFRFCLGQILNAIERDEPLSPPPVVH
jgi:hypothetical protein